MLNYTQGMPMHEIDDDSSYVIVIVFVSSVGIKIISYNGHKIKRNDLYIDKYIIKLNFDKCENLSDKIK